MQMSAPTNYDLRQNKLSSAIAQVVLNNQRAIQENLKSIQNERIKGPEDIEKLVNRINAVSSVANTAKSTAESANTKANAATAAVEALTPQVDTNTANINTLNSNLQTVQGIAETANTNATNALSIANTALSTAQTADSTANTALSTAQTADSTANTALSTAQTADSTANTALSTAQTADSNANTAITGVNTLTSIVGATENDGLRKSVSDLETTVGDSTSGLVKDVADLQTAIADVPTVDAVVLKNPTSAQTITNDITLSDGKLNIGSTQSNNDLLNVYGNARISNTIKINDNTYINSRSNGGIIFSRPDEMGTFNYLDLNASQDKNTLHINSNVNKLKFHNSIQMIDLGEFNVGESGQPASKISLNGNAITVGNTNSGSSTNIYGSTVKLGGSESDQQNINKITLRTNGGYVGMETGKFFCGSNIYTLTDFVGYSNFYNLNRGNLYLGEESFRTDFRTYGDVNTTNLLSNYTRNAYNVEMGRLNSTEKYGSMMLNYNNGTVEEPNVDSMAIRPSENKVLNINGTVPFINNFGNSYTISNTVTSQTISNVIPSPKAIAVYYFTATIPQLIFTGTHRPTNHDEVEGMDLVLNINQNGTTLVTYNFTYGRLETSSSTTTISIRPIEGSFITSTNDPIDITVVVTPISGYIFSGNVQSFSGYGYDSSVTLNAGNITSNEITVGNNSSNGIINLYTNSPEQVNQATALGEIYDTATDDTLVSFSINAMNYEGEKRNYFRTYGESASLQLETDKDILINASDGLTIETVTTCTDDVNVTGTVTATNDIVAGSNSLNALSENAVLKDTTAATQIISSGLTVDGNMQIGNSENFDLTVTGYATFGKTQNSSQVTVNGPSNLNGNTTIGTTSSNANLTVNGTITSTGDVQAGSNSLNALATTIGDSSSGLVQKVNTLESDALSKSTTANQTIASKVTINNEVEIGSIQFYNQTSTSQENCAKFGAPVLMEDNLTVEGEINVGTYTDRADLTVNGDTQLNGNTTIGTTTSNPYNLTVNGDIEARNVNIGELTASSSVNSPNGITIGNLLITYNSDSNTISFTDSTTLKSATITLN